MTTFSPTNIARGFATGEWTDASGVVRKPADMTDDHIAGALSWIQEHADHYVAVLAAACHPISSGRFLMAIKRGTSLATLNTTKLVRDLRKEQTSRQLAKEQAAERALWAKVKLSQPQSFLDGVATIRLLPPGSVAARLAAKIDDMPDPETRKAASDAVTELLDLWKVPSSTVGSIVSMWVKGLRGLIEWALMPALQLEALWDGRRTAAKDFMARRLVDFKGGDTSLAACAWRLGYWERLARLVRDDLAATS